MRRERAETTADARIGNASTSPAPGRFAGRRSSRTGHGAAEDGGTLLKVAGTVSQSHLPLAAGVLRDEPMVTHHEHLSRLDGDRPEATRPALAHGGRGVQ